MSRARVFLAVLSCLCLLTESASALPVICQPGRQSLPLPMGSNIGPDVIGPSGYCNWGTASFRATDGSYFAAYHVALDLQPNTGAPGGFIGAQIVNPGIASFGGCTILYPPTVNNVGTLCDSDYLFPASTGVQNHEDAAKICNANPQNGILGVQVLLASTYLPFSLVGFRSTSSELLLVK
jgi:hypothetical protein